VAEPDGKTFSEASNTQLSLNYLSQSGQIAKISRITKNTTSSGQRCKLGLILVPDEIYASRILAYIFLGNCQAKV
jgi:hypothetical protein